MSESGPGGTYFWCLRHRTVETEAQACAAQYRLGPYPSADDATRALDRVKERNASWTAEDVRWAGEES
ncbi:MAG TPA: hypothetical protein VF755_29165 [Catenuloplanes sp.]